MPGIKSVEQVLGPYSLIVKIQMDGQEECKNLYRQVIKIREISDVDSVAVMLVRAITNVLTN